MGTELVCSSISTGGNGADSVPSTHPFLQINPHLRFYNNQRGYVLTKIEADQFAADFKVLPNVSTPDAPAYTRASFVIEDRVAGLHQTYDRPVDPATAARSTVDLARQATEQETVRP